MLNQCLKLICGLVVVGLFLSCSSSDKKNTHVKHEIHHADMDWIIGDWVGGIESEGLVSTEKWIKVSDDRYAADAESRVNGELVNKEHMEISTLDGHHCLIVDHDGAEPVVFDFISEDEDGFICRNESNEFPKQIEYRREGNELVAIISDGAPTLEFRFDKN